MSFDKIHLKGITAKGYHGFYDKERAIGQNFVVDVVMDVDSQNACVEDNLDKTVNYEKVGKAVVKVIEGEGVKLIETLAERIALVVLCFENVCEVSVTVHKPEAPLDYEFEDVALTISRNRSNLRIGFENSAYFIKSANFFENINTDTQEVPSTIVVEKNTDFDKQQIVEPEEKTDAIDVTLNKDEDFPPIFNPEKANVILALGGNLGNPVALFQDVISDLDKSLGFDVLEVSPLVKSKAHTLDGETQPDYYNCVLNGQTFLSPKDLLSLVKEVEHYFGRREHKKWESRLIDIDIISYNNTKYEDDKLVIPHKLAKERAFVLVPWALMDSTALLGEEKVTELSEKTPDRDGILNIWNDWLGKTVNELEILSADSALSNIQPDTTELRIIDDGIDIFTNENADEFFDDQTTQNVETNKEKLLTELPVNDSQLENIIENQEEFEEIPIPFEDTETISEELSKPVLSENTIANPKETVSQNQIDEVLNTLEHTKVMNQLRTLFNNGVEDDTAKTYISSENKLATSEVSKIEEKLEEVSGQKVTDIQETETKVHNKHVGNYESESLPENEAQHQAPVLGRSSIYEALRKKTFDEAMAPTKPTEKNIFKPKWQSLELGE